MMASQDHAPSISGGRPQEAPSHDLAYVWILESRLLEAAKVISGLAQVLMKDGHYPNSSREMIKFAEAIRDGVATRPTVADGDRSSPPNERGDG